jgi:hypothetical protein
MGCLNPTGGGQTAKEGVISWVREEEDVLPCRGMGMGNDCAVAASDHPSAMATVPVMDSVVRGNAGGGRQQ